MSTSVKYFHSAMTGAPAMANTAGAMIAILDACLKDGFNLKTVDSIVVTDNVATVSMSAGVGAFEADAVTLIAGATPAGLNGEKRILSTTSNTITFATTGISNQTATGSITAKMAPAGWDKPFSGTNLAAYRSADVTGTRMYLRVDDTGTINSRVVGYESMTDVNTGVKPFPTGVQQSGGIYWPKVTSAYKAWVVIADSKTLWLWTHGMSSENQVGVTGITGGFGDFASNKAGDTYACLLQGNTNNESNGSSALTHDIAYSSSTTALSTSGTVVARSFTGLGGAQPVARMAESYHNPAGAWSGNSSLVALYPNGPDNALLLSRVLVVEAVPALRGSLRGPWFFAQPGFSRFNWRDKIDGQGVLAGRKLMALRGSAPTGNGIQSLTFFDITGPWA